MIRHHQRTNVKLFTNSCSGDDWLAEAKNVRDCQRKQLSASSPPRHVAYAPYSQAHVLKFRTSEIQNFVASRHDKPDFVVHARDCQA